MMVTRFLLLLVLPLVLFYSACSKSEPISPSAVEDERSSEEQKAEKEMRAAAMLSILKAPQRSLNEALAIAESVLPTQHAGRKVRGASSEFVVNCVLAEKGKKVRSSEDTNPSVDTMLYVINKRDGGYLIVSGDKRVPDLLAYSEHGSLDLHNLPTESGIFVFMSLLPDFYEQRINAFQQELNYIKPDPPEDTDYPGYEEENPYLRISYTPWKATDSLPALVPVRWHQSSPFNNNAPVINSLPTVAGCVAIATAQLLTAHKYPTAYAGVNLDWELLTKHKRAEDYTGEEYSRFAAQVAPLIREIGDELHNEWGINGTGAYPDRIPYVLERMGYKHPSEETWYNYQGIISSLSNKRPVIMSGYANKNTIKWRTIFGIVYKTEVVYSGGHVWLCDGYKNEERKIIGHTQETTDKGFNIGVEVIIGKETRELLHCNWGWKSKKDKFSDTYCLAGVFDAANPVYGSKIEGASHYKYKLKNILDIHR
jgi:putative pyrogenic exotoxin B